MLFRKRMTRKSKLLKMGFKFNSIDQRTEEVVNKFCYELRADHLDTAAVENLLRVYRGILFDLMLTVSHHHAAVKKENAILMFLYTDKEALLTLLRLLEYCMLQYGSALQV